MKLFIFIALFFRAILPAVSELSGALRIAWMVALVRLPAFLRATSDANHQNLRTSILFRLALRAATVVGTHDRWMSMNKRGEVQVSIIDLNETGSLIFENRRVRLKWNSSTTPQAKIIFTRSDLFLAGTQRALDQLAAVGSNELHVHGNIPLADQAGAVLDRVSHYLK